MARYSNQLNRSFRLQSFDLKENYEMASIDEIKLLFEASNANTSKGFENLRTEMKNFKEEVKQSVTESLKTVNEKVDMLETKLNEKDEEIMSLKRDLELNKRKNNLIVFGVKDNEHSPEELEAVISNLFKKVTGIEMKENDFNDIYRLGKKGEKPRPIIVSLGNGRKMRVILQKKNLFKMENITVSADLPKEVVEERKRLQPMITSLNQAGTKAYLRLDDVFVNGKKLTKQETEEEMQKFRSTTKRGRSPEEIPLLPKRLVPPKLNINAAKQQIKSNKQGISQEPCVSTSPPHTPSNETFSTPSRIFPVFKLPQTTSRGGELSPLPGGSKHSKTFEVRGD